MSTNLPAADRLFSLYRRFVGEPEGPVEVYLGFALFFAGIALGALGLLLFLWSSTLTPTAGLYWPLRELAIVLAILGLPTFVLSLVVLLPVDRRARNGAVLGALICLVAIALFVTVYPEQWNVAGTDYSARGIAIYAAGLAVLAAASGAGLVGHQLERAGATGTGSDTESSAEERASVESVTDEQVRQDIEAAMESTELTWGGVEKDETKRLSIDTSEEGIDTSGFDTANVNTARSKDDSVSSAVNGLRKLQGRNRTQERSDPVDDQTQALAELRARQGDEDEAEPSILDRLRDRIGL